MPSEYNSLQGFLVRIDFISMTLTSDFLVQNGPGAQTEQAPIERRLVDRLGVYWTEISIDRGFARLEDIDPWMIGDDWKSCFLVELRSSYERSSLLAIGEGLAARPDQQMLGGIVADYRANSLVGLVTSRLPRVLSTRDCIVDEGAARHEGKQILYRCTLLPLSMNGGNIDHVLAAVNYKSVATVFH